MEREIPKTVHENVQNGTETNGSDQCLYSGPIYVFCEWNAWVREKKMRATTEITFYRGKEIIIKHCAMTDLCFRNILKYLIFVVFCQKNKMKKFRFRWMKRTAKRANELQWYVNAALIWKDGKFMIQKHISSTHKSWQKNSQPFMCIVHFFSLLYSSAFSSLRNLHGENCLMRCKHANLQRRYAHINMVRTSYRNLEFQHAYGKYFWHRCINENGLQNNMEYTLHVRACVRVVVRL